MPGCWPGWIPRTGWRFIREALESDIADTQGGTTAEGIHLGAMAGTVDIVLRCLTGMRLSGEVLRFDPVLLPPEIRSISFSVHHREHRVAITLTDDHMTVGSRPGDHHRAGSESGTTSREIAPGTQALFLLHRNRHARDIS